MSNELFLIGDKVEMTEAAIEMGLDGARKRRTGTVVAFHPLAPALMKVRRTGLKKDEIYARSLWKHVEIEVIGKRKKQKNLGAELFGLVESDQGYAFVSDAISGLPNDRVFDIARGALKHTEATVRKIRLFLLKYGEKP